MKTNNRVFLMALQALLGAGFIATHSWANPAEIPDTKDGTQDYVALSPPKKNDSSIPEPARVMLETEVSKITRVAQRKEPLEGCRYSRTEKSGRSYVFCCVSADAIRAGAYGDANPPAPDCDHYAQKTGQVWNGNAPFDKKCTVTVTWGGGTKKTFTDGVPLSCDRE